MSRFFKIMEVNVNVVNTALTYHQKSFSAAAVSSLSMLVQRAPHLGSEFNDAWRVVIRK